MQDKEQFSFNRSAEMEYHGTFNNRESQDTMNLVNTLFDLCQLILGNKQVMERKSEQPKTVAFSPKFADKQAAHAQKE